jgi:hypothetical protein
MQLDRPVEILEATYFGQNAGAMFRRSNALAG